MNSPLLNRLLHLKENSPFIIIEDTIIQSGLTLLKEFIKSAKMIDVFVLDGYTYSHPYEIDESFSCSDSDSNHSQGTLTINSKSQFIKRLDDFQMITNKLKDLIHNLYRFSHTPPFRVDNINFSITEKFDRSCSCSCSCSLKKKKSIPTFTQSFNIIILVENSRLIAIYHSDIPTASSALNIRNTLSHLATTTITLKNSERFQREINRPGFANDFNEEMITDEINSLISGVCIMEHKKRSGKVLYETNTYLLDDMGSNLVISQTNGIKEDLDFNEEKTSDPTTANLLFNLSLTEKQKKAKDQVILPYTKVQDQYETEGSLVGYGDHSSSSGGGGGGGSIFYEPDDADDFDEEDPDEDLVI
ncbi:hypothetical protein G9A89_015408 [Geosiphon pyriformis]|nr:hypothetical protein G9A89_015408 [Geosiphon pyriformis]